MEHIIKELNDNWTLKECSKREKYEARVPGSVMETLLENDVIADPFYGMNEKECQWVFDRDWEYTTTITATDELINKDFCILKFYGLDSICEVFLNDRLILFSDNMHRTHEIYLKTNEFNYLEKEKNVLRLIFRSPVKEAFKRLKELGTSIDETLDKALPFAIPGVETLRKAYFSFGWDWGPKLPDSGIWRKVELHAFNQARIKDIHIETDIEYTIGEGTGLTTAEKAKITMDFEFQLFANKTAKKIVYEISDKKGQIKREEFILQGSGTQKTVVLEHPHLWWTHDLCKEPHLYMLNLKLYDNDRLLDEVETQFGIRDIQLIRNKDQWGESFYFELNKIPLFIKGGNWIPSDSFIARGNRNALYEKILTDCIKANMNMIRIWGGGVYEEDDFYDFCDKNGLLVWQDFAFACRPTPDFSGFEESIIKEAIDNIKRLRNHPSLAIWTGNNEIEEGWVHWGFEEYVPHLKKFYLKLFEKTLPNIVDEYDSKRPYWPSSPSSGGGFNNTQSPDYGDSHFWKVWHEGYPLESYRDFDSRFMSEFGFESFPSMKTIKSFCESDKLFFNSDVMNNHQKNPAGNKKIYDYMEKRFNIPEGFERQVILSQITQAEAMEYGVEHWRRKRNNCHCMGALYWQINDCWPVASWSSIDYFGRWKALQYFAKRFYNPLYINALETDKDFEVWFCNDRPSKFMGKYSITVLTLTGRVLYSNEADISAPGLFATVLEKVILEDIGAESQDSVAFFKAYDNNGQVVSESFKLFAPPKDIKLQRPMITFELEAEDDHYIIKLKSDKPAIYCFIKTDSDIVFSDNFFSLHDEEKIVRFESKTAIKKSDIIIASLYDLMD